MIGADRDLPPETDLTVNLDRTQALLPWDTIVPKGAVQHIATLGGWRTTTLKEWFANVGYNPGMYANLETFDGSGVIVDDCTSVEGL